jgi:hypothetical protein
MAGSSPAQEQRFGSVLLMTRHSLNGRAQRLNHEEHEEHEEQAKQGRNELLF